MTLRLIRGESLPHPSGVIHRGPNVHAVASDSGPTVRSMSPYLQQWVLAMRGRGLAERTIEDQPSAVRRIADDMGEAAELLTTEQLRAWFARKQLKPGSRATYRTALRAWFHFLILNEIRADDPTVRLETNASTGLHAY